MEIVKGAVREDTDAVEKGSNVKQRCSKATRFGFWAIVKEHICWTGLCVFRCVRECQVRLEFTPTAFCRIRLYLVSYLEAFLELIWCVLEQGLWLRCQEKHV